MSTKIELMDGKYTIEHNNGVGLRCLRYGEYWRDLVGDGMVLALAQEVEDLREQLAQRSAGDDVGMAAFEQWVSENYICNVATFESIVRRDGTIVYVHDVQHKSISGQIFGEKCSVQMLWEAWQASRRAA